MNIEVSAGPTPRPTNEATVAALRTPQAARIPAGLRVEGDAHYPCDVALDGEMHGRLSVSKSATLLVTRNAKADGTIVAGDTFVEGTVNGRIECSEGAVEFAPSSRCTAHVLYRELSIARGAEVDAKLQQVGGRRV